jgi:hypothetical protein
MVELIESNSTLEHGMKRLVVLGLLLVIAACAQQSPPPAASAPPPPVAAAPPPPPPAAPASPPTLASFNGRYAGMATLGVAGEETEGTTNPICVDKRPINMTIRNGYATIWYHDWKLHTLHYRGRVDPDGTIHLSHLNGDGSRSVFTLQLSDTGATGNMLRGNCRFDVSLTKS